jgi:carboxymethylenebutenolidase
MPKVLEPINFSGSRGRINATVASPKGDAPHAAVLLLQEGIGVTPHLLRVAERLSNEGYLVLVPDLYSRDLARQALSEQQVVQGIPIARSPERAALLAALSPGERASMQRVVTWFDGRDESSYFPDALSSLAWLKAQANVRRDAIAAIGFSVGGGLTAKLASSGAELAAGIVFYAKGPAPSTAAQVRFPLQAGRTFSSFVYPGTEHGFFNETRPAYARHAAELAWLRSLEFLKQHLPRAEGARASFRAPAVRL